MRIYSTEQQHHALRIASSRELNSTEASALIRGVEAYRDAEAEIEQLRADLATAKADEQLYIANVARLEEENERWAGELNEAQCNCNDAIDARQLLASELATVTAERDHALSDVATLGDLGANRQKLLLAERLAHAETRKALEKAEHDLSWERGTHQEELESTRAELAKVEARSEADRKVLEACAAMTDEGIGAATGQSISVDKALAAEMARRMQPSESSAC